MGFPARKKIDVKWQFMPQGGHNRSNNNNTSEAEKIYLYGYENTRNTLKDKITNLKETW